MTDAQKPLQSEMVNPFTSVPIEVVVSVGRAKPMISELVTLGQNSVLELDRRLEDPVDLFVGDKLIARGTLEDSGDPDGKLHVRLTEIVDLKSGIS